MGCSCSKNAALEPRRPGLPTLLGAVPKHSEPSDPKGEKDVEKAQKAERLLKFRAMPLQVRSGIWSCWLWVPNWKKSCKILSSWRPAATWMALVISMHTSWSRRLGSMASRQSGSSENHDGTNPRLMAGQRVSKESFAEMVASQRSTKLIRAFDSNTVKVLLGGNVPKMHWQYWHASQFWTNFDRRFVKRFFFIF